MLKWWRQYEYAMHNDSISWFYVLTLGFDVLCLTSKWATSINSTMKTAACLEYTRFYAHIPTFKSKFNAMSTKAKEWSQRSSINQKSKQNKKSQDESSSPWNVLRFLCVHVHQIRHKRVDISPKSHRIQFVSKRKNMWSCHKARISKDKEQKNTQFSSHFTEQSKKSHQAQ